MKIKREIRVGILAILTVFLLYFGFNFLKGVNIFHPTNTYVGVFQKMNGLVEQSPVYIRGFRVGQVEEIVYDFSKEEAFTVYFSINTDIRIPEGTKLSLRPDGLISGEALELVLPVGQATAYLPKGSAIPSEIVPSMMETLQAELMSKLGGTIEHVDSLIVSLQSQLSDDQLHAILTNVNEVTYDLKGTSRQLKVLMRNDVPVLVADAKETMASVRKISAELAEADLQGTVQKADSAIAGLQSIIEVCNSEEGTVGMLLNNKDLYMNLNGTIQSADSLLQDLKANPKRYVHFSLFGRNKDK